MNGQDLQDFSGFTGLKNVSDVTYQVLSWFGHWIALAQEPALHNNGRGSTCFVAVLF
jgi:hypothetical protein